MSDQPSLHAGYADVDGSEHARLMVQGMDETAAWPATQALRRHSDASLRLAPGHAVLDVGCGPGNALLALAEQVLPGGRAAGLDSSSVMLEEVRRRAAERGLDVEVVQGDACNLQVDDATFDACRSERTLQWVREPERAVAEMVRVLRPGGRLSVIDTDWGMAVMDHPDEALTGRVIDGMMGASPNSRGARRLVGLFRAAGLEDVDVAAETALFTEWHPDRGPVPGMPPFDMLADVARQNGNITAEEGERWLAALTDAARGGHFFAAITMLSVAGRKPA